MQLHEFNNQSIDVLELLLCDYRKLIEDLNIPLSEASSNDKVDYIKFIELERQHCVSTNQLVKGQSYAPLSLLGSPASFAMAIRTTQEDVKFDSLQNQITFVKSNGQSAIFPPNNISTEDSSVDTLIFNDQSEKTEFLTALHLKFLGWNFYTNYI
jgi:hypothetical protein